MIDVKVVDDGNPVHKSISQTDNVFACVEEIIIDNVTTTYTWIGYITGDPLFIFAEANGTYYGTLGQIQGDTINVFGSVELSPGMFAPLQIELIHIHLKHELRLIYFLFIL